MEFTNEEKERINQLYGNDFADIKPEDALLISRWEQYKISIDETFKAKQKAIEDEANERLNQARSLSDKAMENLNELKNAALARLEMIENG